MILIDILEDTNEILLDNVPKRQRLKRTERTRSGSLSTQVTLREGTLIYAENVYLLDSGLTS
jgi:hypothetical protein